MSSASYVVGLLSPTLASSTIAVSLRPPFWLGIFPLLPAVPTLYILPSPANQGDGSESPNGEQREPLLSSLRLKTQAHQKLLRSTTERLQAIHAIIITHYRKFSLWLLSFMLTSLASSDTKLPV